MEEIARQTRLNIVKAARSVGSVHFGGCFSVTEILAAYYSPVINKEMTFAQFIKNNTLVLSKGHCGLAVYALLNAIGAVSNKQMAAYCKDDGAFMGHIRRNAALGIGWSTGSLGHGLSISLGLSGALKYAGKTGRVTCVLGDGEMNEGSNWEALLHLSHDDSFPLTIVLDNNKFCSLGATQDIRPLEPIQAKISDFGIPCVSVDGHDVQALRRAMDEGERANRTLFINANTLKGKGISFTEGVSAWHAKRPSEEELQRMETELSAGTS
jgi:transketolase